MIELRNLPITGYIAKSKLSLILLKIKFMKYLLAVIVIFSFISKSTAQESYKKRYYVNEKVYYGSQFQKNGEEKKEFRFLKVKDSLCDINKTEIEVDGKTTTKIDTIGRKVSFDKLGILGESKWYTQIYNPTKGRLKANIKFEGNKILVNPWLLGETDYIDPLTEREKIYYFELKNRQSLKISFSQWSLNALTVPLKVRFGEDKTEFSTGANLGAFFGYTWGKTNFLHRKKIGNKQYDSKVTTGLFLGADKLEFSFEDTNMEDQTVKTAFLSVGSGVLYSYQKFTIGITGGLDFGLGENSKKWDFQGRPWLGATLGYSLFTF